MLIFENKIIDFFHQRFKNEDTYKDANDKGIFERYNEVIGNDIDEKVTPFIYNMHDNLLVPETVLDKMLPILEYGLGINLDMGESNRRLVMQYITKFYHVKGTKKGYAILFEMLGFTNTEVIFEDSVCQGTTFDEGNFDDACAFDIDVEGEGSGLCSTCFLYRLILTGPITLTPEIERLMENIIEFNEPINAELTNITIIEEDGDFSDDFNEDYFI